MSPIKNSHFSSVKCPLLLVGLLVTLVSTLIPTTHAAQSEPEFVVCDKQGIVRIPLAPTWEKVTSSHPQALCVFRSKNVGFPTLTVVQATPIAAREIDSEAAKLAYLEKSYTAVGISGAKASNLRSINRAKVRGYSAEVSFTAQAGDLRALVSVFELPDRSYIVTLLDRAEAFESSKHALYTVAQGVAIEAPSTPNNPALTESSGGNSKNWVLLLAAVALILGTAVWINRVKRP
jgi:hypothetical protein